MPDLIKWDEIESRIAIATENDLGILKKFHAALNSKEFRKQIDGSIRAINKCEKYKIKIEIAFGDYYKGLEDKRGDKPHNLKDSLSQLTNPKQQAEEDIGKSRVTINKYARMSTINESDVLLEQYESVCNDKEKEMSSAGFLKFAREKQHENLPEPIMPSNKYRIIYADPPWKYGNTMPNYVTEQADYYKLMTIDELCLMKLPEIEDNAVLFLWVTSPILEESFKIINAWNFEYKSSFIWDKIKHNMGHYNSVRHELLLICVRGSCQPDIKKLFDSVQSIERTEHSKKPEEFRTIIDTVYPKGNRIELFARGKYNGWDSYGNQL